MQISQKLSGALAELHLHLYGAIASQDYLEFVRDQTVDWAFYESAYQAAYGEFPPIRDVLERHRTGVPDTEHEFHRLFVFADQDAGNFERIQAKFNLLDSSSQMMDFLRGDRGFSAVVDEVCYFLHRVIKTQQRQNIHYTEQRISLNRELSPFHSKEMLLAMLEAYSEYEGSDFQPRLAVSLPREDPWPQWEVTKDLALGLYGHLLTGIDFCSIEEGHPPKEQESFLNEVKDFNRRNPERAMAILYHVGESFQDKSLESAVRWVQEAAELGAHRLGHAIALGVDPSLYGKHQRHESVGERIDQLKYELKHADGLRRLGVVINENHIQRELEQLIALPIEQTITVSYDKQRLNQIRLRQNYAMERIRSIGAIVEVCPTSNRRIGGVSQLEHHPVHRFWSNQVPFVIGSDDPGIFDTTLAQEIDWAAQALGLDAETVNELAERSWRYRSEVVTGRQAYI